MMLLIRAFTEEDYEGITAVWNAAWPDFRKTAGEIRSSDKRRKPDHFWQRLVVETNGRLIGYGQIAEAYWTQLEDHFYTEFTTHPDFMGLGAASLFYEKMLTTLQEEGGWRYLTAETREDYTEAVQFLTEQGFKPVMRYPISHLDVTGFDATPYLARLNEVEAGGIDIIPLAELQARDNEWQAKTHRMIADALQDVPSPDAHTEFEFEEFELAIQSPNFLPEGVFVAVDNGQLVAISELWRSQAEPDKLYTGLTGVVRSHRRRGLATAVKVHAIQFAQANGITTLVTDNEENNPMFQLNLRLGFQPQPAIVEFKKVLE